jgi:hypothetical protein
LNSLNKDNFPTPLLLLLTVLGLASLSVYLFAFMHYQTDTASYLNAVEIFMGHDAEKDVSHRIVKIVNYLFPALLYQFGLDIKYGFFAQQWLSYGGSAFFAYQFFRALNFNPKQAFYGVFAYLTCQCVAIFNFAIMTDGLGWMMELWGLWLSTVLLNELRQKKVNIGLCLQLGLVFGFGLLMKESVLMAGLYLFIGIIWSPASFKQKFFLNLWVGLSFLSILISLSVYTELQYGKSMLSWWKFAHTDPITYQQPFKIYFIQLARTLDLHWFWVILGLSLYLREFQQTDFRLKSLFLAAALGLLIFPFAWPYLTDRIMFMIPILLLPALVRAIQQWSNLGFILLIIGGLANLWMTYEIYYHKQQGYLVVVALVYGVLLLGTWIYKKYIKKQRINNELY